MLFRPPFRRPFATERHSKSDRSSCLDRHFGDPSQHRRLGSRCAWSCLDRHFGDPSQRRCVSRRRQLLFRPPFRRPFATRSGWTARTTSLFRPPFRRPFATQGDDPPRGNQLFRPPFRRPFATGRPADFAQFVLFRPPFRRPFATVSGGWRRAVCYLDRHFGDPSQQRGANCRRFP